MLACEVRLFAGRLRLFLYIVPMTNESAKHFDTRLTPLPCVANVHFSHGFVDIMIKPDGVQRGLVGEIIKRFEAKGYVRVCCLLDCVCCRYPLISYRRDHYHLTMYHVVDTNLWP